MASVCLGIGRSYLVSESKENRMIRPGPLVKKPRKTVIEFQSRF